MNETLSVVWDDCKSCCFGCFNVLVIILIGVLGFIGAVVLLSPIFLVVFLPLFLTGHPIGTAVAYGIVAIPAVFVMVLVIWGCVYLVKHCCKDYPQSIRQRVEGARKDNDPSTQLP